MKPVSRRAFLLSTICGAAVFADAAAARTIVGIPWKAGQADTPNIPDGSFLTTDERRTLEAICNRLIPSDNLGPGAVDSGVVDFIDRQLSGFYGRGDRWYMLGPFEDGTDEQGYQAELPPAGLYREGLAALEHYCQTEFSLAFPALQPDQQDALLRQMEEGEIDFDNISPSALFDIVLENTIEGFFSDPIYGGNRDMAGWKLVGFPGARYDYRPYINHNGAAIDIQPVGLMGRPEWNPR